MNKFGSQNMFLSLKRVMVKKPQNFMSTVNTVKWNYTSPLDQELINKNYQDFISIIKNFGSEIIELNWNDVQSYFGPDNTIDFEHVFFNCDDNLIQ